MLPVDPAERIEVVRATRDIALESLYPGPETETERLINGFLQGFTERLYDQTVDTRTEMERVADQHFKPLFSLLTHINNDLGTHFDIVRDQNRATELVTYWLQIDNHHLLMFTMKIRAGTPLTVSWYPSAALHLPYDPREEPFGKYPFQKQLDTFLNSLAKALGVFCAVNLKDWEKSDVR